MDTIGQNTKEEALDKVDEFDELWDAGTQGRCWLAVWTILPGCWKAELQDKKPTLQKDVDKITSLGSECTLDSKVWLWTDQRVVGISCC